MKKNTQNFFVFLMLMICNFSYANSSKATSHEKSLAAVTEDNNVNPPQPNIILFYIDDMGWQDTSEPFLYDNAGNEVVTPLNQRYRTPNMEALADLGVKFTNAYAMPVCTPSRISLMTGKNSVRHKVTNWVDPAGVDTDQNTTTSHNGPANWLKEGLSTSEITLPSLLQNAGYRTILAGKAHFGASNYAKNPLNVGFDVNIAGSEIGRPGSYLGDYGQSSSRPVQGLDQYHNTGTFLTEALTLEMNSAIEDAVNDGIPFFAYMTHYAVHSPFDKDPRFTANYPGLSGKELGYATLIEGMDKSLGDMMAKLQALGVAENTLIIFMTDNGGDAPTEFVNQSNAPLRHKKGSQYEGGVRVPLMAAWAQPNPANPIQSNLQIPQGAVENDIVTVFDMFPTILGVANASYSHSIDGVDLQPYFRADPGTHREQELLIHFPHDHRTDYYTIYREGDWKLIYNYASDTYELYNLANDLSEANNLFSSEHERVMIMARKMAQKLDEGGAQWPTFESNGQDDPFRMPDLPNVDVDNDGIPDNVEDPNFNGLVDAGETDPDVPQSGCTVGTPCNDGNPCTTGDTYNSDCDCVGTGGGNASSSESIMAVADALVRGGSYGNTNYGSSNDLITKFAGNDKYHRKSYLKFDLTAYDAANLVSATLELKVINNSTNNVSQNLFHVQDDNWAENSITWNNQPTTAPLITSFAAPVAGQQVSIDISADVLSALSGNKILSLKLEGTNNKYVAFASREQGNDAAPKLILNLDACDDTPCPDSDADGICDADDDTNGNCTLNASCDDGDSCTTGDIYDANCNCSGTFQDSDNDGICDANDNTNGNCTLNTSCDDGDPCTTGETYDANCNCAGGTPVGGNNSTDLLNPTGDTYIRGGTYAGSNYGNSTTIHIKKGGNDKWTRYGYLKFDVSGVDAATLQSAKFRIKVSSNSDGSVAQELLLAPSDNWTESGLTWNNNQFGGTSIINFTAASAGQWVEIDVTSTVQSEATGDGTLSLAIISDNNKYIRYHTKESNGNEPELVLTYGGGCNNKIQQYDDPEIKIYPNPSREYVTIEMSQNLQQELEQISIYAVTGELIRIKNTELSTPIYVGDLTPGIYIIQAEGAGKKWHSKLIKN